MTFEIPKPRPWADRLKDDELTKHASDAQYWHSCAVGEHLGFHEDVRTVTIDQYLRDNHKRLYKLGQEFYRAVENGAYGSALTIKEEIDRYVGALDYDLYEHLKEHTT